MRRVLVPFYFVVLLGFIIPLFGYLYGLNKGVSDYYMDINVLSNGDVNIKDLHYLKGTYNGEENIYSYNKGNYIKNFKGTTSDLSTNAIYNPDAVVINNVKLVPKKLINSFNNINDRGITATLVSNANIGDNGVYTETDNGSSINVRTYNNTSYGFYTDYTYKNMAVKHGDVSELNINLFNNYRESIKNLVVYLHINSNKDLLKVYGHGSKVKIINNNTVKITLSDIPANIRFDLRVLFDRDAINTTKITDYDVTNTIEQIESELVTNSNYGKIIVNVILYVVCIGFILLGLIDKLIKKEKKYNRDIPDMPIEYANYILKGKITGNDFLAAMLSLVDKGIVTFEKIDGVDDYYIKHNIDAEKIDGYDTSVLGALVVGDVTKLSDIKALAKIKESSFVFCYTNWAKKILKDVKEEKYFESGEGGNVKTCVKTENLVYFLLAFGVSILLGSLPLGIISLILALLTIMLGDFNYVRTEKGNQAYDNVSGLKNFINDFSRLDEKTLPEVHLWNKYLMYATAFGLSAKVYDTLKLHMPDNINPRLNEMIALDSALDILSQSNYLRSYSTLEELNRSTRSNSFGGTSSDSSGGFGGIGGSFGGSGISSGGGGGHSGGRF